jgi:dCTP deaminase
MLNDTDIRYQIEHNNLVIAPYEPKNLQTASVDLRLDASIIVPEGGKVIDRMLGKVPQDKAQTFEKHWLYPNQFILGCTLEYVAVPHYLAGELVGKSTLARDGLIIECAGYVDPGWSGKLTLEMKNIGPNTIILRPGMLICQIRFHELSVISRNQTSFPYGSPSLDSHYQFSLGPHSGHPTSGRMEIPESSESDSSPQPSEPDPA